MGGHRDVPSTYFVEELKTGSRAASAGAGLITGENMWRKNWCIVNDTPDPIFLRFVSSPASSLLYNVRVPSYQLYEIMKPPITGSIYIAFGGVSGSVQWMEVA